MQRGACVYTARDEAQIRTAAGGVGPGCGGRVRTGEK